MGEHRPSRVKLLEDTEGVFHYRIYTPGEPSATKGPVACGQTDPPMRRGAAWFHPGDPRGRVHYERACDTCRDALSF